MKYNPVTRRHFLQGLGGFYLSLPFLPSLFPRQAHAQTAQALPSFFYFATEHGGVYPTDIYGELLGYLETPVAGLTAFQYLQGGVDVSTGKSFPTQVMHSGNLSNFLRTAAQAGEAEDPDNGQQRLSFILGSEFNPHLDKITLLRGVDHHWRSHGHGTGMHLGNFRSIQNGPKDLLPSAASIDTVLANSNKFYPSLAGVTLKQFVSYTGSVLSHDSTGSSLSTTESYTGSLFDKIFNGSQGMVSSPVSIEKANVIDKVIEDHRRFLSPNSATGRRISSEDKNAYNNFLDKLSEVQRRLTATANCNPGDRPANIRMRYQWDRHEEIWRITSEIMALAFTCGACRLGTAHLADSFLNRNSSYKSDYHQAIAHGSAGGTIARIEHRRFHRVALQEAYLPMIEILNSFSGIQEGTTVLDQSLICFQPQAGLSTHRFINNFVVASGGASGKLNTGKFIDFRSLQNRAFEGWGSGAHPGLAQNQFLATVMQAMGLSPSDYEDPAKFGGPAYGGWYVDPKLLNNGHIGMPDQLKNKSGEPMPLWWKT